MKSLLVLLLLLPFVSSADENCAKPTVSCDMMEQVIATLKLKHEQIKDSKDIEDYLAIHNQLATCPGFKGECPAFISKQWLGPQQGIMLTHSYESFGSPCSLRKPLLTYDLKDQTLAHQIGSNISLEIKSQCGPNLFMKFTAYNEGLLVMSGREEGGRFDSNEVARRILLNTTEVSVESQDPATMRINWKRGNKTQWLDIDTRTMTFKESNFMKVDQLNSGSCQVERLVQPAPICDKNRKALIKYKVIKSPEEYECYEYVPVINGVPNRISRG